MCAGICPARQRDDHQDGREQPGHGDGAQLPSVPIRRSADHLREHAQGDVLPENAHRSPGHQFHRRGGVDAALSRPCVISSYTFTIMHKH